MDMVIEKYIVIDGKERPLGDTPILRYPNMAGWPTPSAYVQEGLRRFKSCNPVPYKNGLQMMVTNARDLSDCFMRVYFADEPTRQPGAARESIIDRCMTMRAERAERETNPTNGGRW